MSEAATSRRRRLVIGLGCLVTVFGVLPWSLGALAESKQDHVNATLRRCEPDFDGASTAVELRVAQGYFPGFGAVASAGRSAVIYSVANGVAVCMIDQSPPVAIHDGFLVFVRQHADAITADSGDARVELERELHRLALDRELLELSSRWPVEGAGRGRSTAYLHVGDLAGAAELWRTDGVSSDRFGFSTYPPGVLLCMAGNHDEGLRWLRAWMQDHPDEVWRDKARAAWAECAVRSGDPVALDEALHDAPPSLTKYYRARVEAERGREERALALLDWEHREDEDLDAQLLQVWLLLRLGRVSEALTVLENDRLGYALREVGGEDTLDERIYNEIYFPMVDERRLDQIASLLHDARPEPPAADDELASRLRSALASIHLWLAIEQGVRWNDAEAAERLSAARRAWPQWGRPDDIERLLADVHGGLVSKALLAQDHPDPPLSRDFALVLLNPPGKFGVHAQLGSILGARSMDVRHKQIHIARQEQDRSWRTHFLHLTIRISAAEALGADASELREQLGAVRALVEGEPNAHLLQFSI